MNGDSLLFKSFPHVHTHIHDLEWNNSSKIYITGTWFDTTDYCINKINIHDLSIDTVFDITTLPYYDPLLYYEETEISFITDTTFVFAAIDLDKLVNICILDTSFNVLHNTTIGSENYQNKFALANSISTIDNNSFFVGSYYPFWGPYSCAKLDNELNLIWEQFYDFDNLVFLFNVFATNDGGCLILGTTSTYNTYNILAIKTDPDGNITHINGEPSNQQAHEVILYPNPGTTELNIRKAAQLKNCNFLLYDNSGKLVMQKELISSVTTITTSFLQNGVYLYKVTDGDKIVETGKWLKTD